MSDYRSLVAPFLESIRKARTQDKTLKEYARTLNESIDFLEHGHFDAPTEDYYTGLDTYLREIKRFAQSTTKDKIKLTRKFFMWTQKGEGQLPMTDTQNTEEIISISNDEAPALSFPYEQEEIHHVAEQSSHEAPKVTPQSTETEGEALQTTTSHTKRAHQQAPKSSKLPKLTIYPTPELDADIKDLANIAGLPVSTFILKIIERETQNRKDDLAVIRKLRAKTV